ncbi:TRAP transporter large permease subunit [Halomonas sp. YLB-10]|uniref:Na+/H+ antiporter family protein n=1 Tax=Halomonas sp. YLB-10 TaxID=2483111 RepID=UPI000F6002A1|nr:Na+/H+ antiporter NhaC family protein [Halomonas sp. YLB-10]RQW69479.1 TRAP transporter large permease subunit [Halomonas sp. YLB-10]
MQETALTDPSPKANRFARTRALPTIALCALIYASTLAVGYHINAAVLTILSMIVLCLLRIPVAIALISAAMLGALHAGLSMNDAIGAFNDNLLVGAQVGLTYVMIGAFAVALSRSGLLELLADAISARLGSDEQSTRKGVKWTLFGLFIVASLMSQNLVPVHIAFIPILLPPLLVVLDRLRVDRRAVACILACSISASYLLLPTGFDAIFLNEILLANVNSVGADYGLTATADMAPKAMALPVLGLVAGLLVAVFISYRRPRDYVTPSTTAAAARPASPARLKPLQLVITLGALAVALVFQLKFDSLLLGAMVGFLILGVSGIFRWQEQDDVFTDGLRMMAQIAVIITVASGFAGVLTATGEIEPLVAASAELIGGNMALGAAVMLVVGLFITIGFGDSFASVPILASIYLPLALTLGFDPLAAMALLGASAALGDAGSPASTITLGATAGLNADGQHDHIRDSVIPTFLHCNIGMLVFAWIAAMVL